MNPKSHRWHKSAMALATAALFGLSAPHVSALSLGSVVVQSALGEPLRAEIDIPDINAEESASLQAAVASPDAFRAAGLEFNAALSGLKVTLMRRTNGRAYIRLTSDRPVNEPFVDLILEASWASGRIVRDYTLLFDPPNSRRPSTAAAPTAPAVGAVQSSAGPAQSAPNAPSSIGAASPAVPRPAVAQPRPGSRPAGAAVAAMAAEGSITVKRGDTASKIANAVKPATVSLDQMLVALLRANPDVFINNNINRIKAGAVMNVPSAEQAQAVGAAEATQTVIAQSRDFGDFRKKLASNVPTEQVAAADRKSGGSIQGKVDDKKASASAPDKLTLSKGAVKAQAETDLIAKERATKEAASRTAEVSRNMSDLAKLGATPGAPTVAGSASASAAAAAPVVTYTAPVAVVASAPSIAVATATPPAIVASAPVPMPVTPPVPAKPMAKPVPLTVAGPTLIDQLTENPLIPAVGIGLVALLAGFGIYRSRQRKKAAMEDSVFLESRLQPDSFFGASGGQKVDTNDAAGGSSMVYTPSQLDAADDVDPVAEADVYLAYGRDIQAEEILKEALKFNPGRVAIHYKLLEIYAKRRDLSAFEFTANEAYRASNGEGADWSRVCEMGQSIDPTNTLYLPGGKPSSAAPLDFPATVAKGDGFGLGASAAAVAGVAAVGAAMASSAASDAANSFAATTAPLTPLPGSATPVDLSFDLDLDFSLDEENASVLQDLGNIERTAKMPALNSSPAPLDMDFDLPVADKPPMPAPSGNSPLEFDLPKNGAIAVPALAAGEAEEFKHQAAVSFGTTVAGPLATFAAKASQSAPDNGGMLEFDLGSLSLDLNDSTEGTSFAQPAESEDPLATKLSLAEEFNMIGDEDGARALIEEVLLEASGDMKTRAQAALSRLN